MLGPVEDFFVEFAQVCKKHKTTASGNLSFCVTKDDLVLGSYKIKEQWINKEGEACVVVKSEDGPHYEIWSNGAKYHHGGYRNRTNT